MNKILCAALTALALTALAPAASQAAVAGSGASESRYVLFSASPGEANNVTVSRQGQDIVIDDAGAAIDPQPGCTRITANRVRCPEPGAVIVELGDGNDRATVAGELAGAADYASLDGEQGDDELIGSGAASMNFLLGGPGRDVLRGGPHTEGYGAVDVLGFGSVGAQPTVRVEPDRVICRARSGGGLVSVDADRTDMLEGPCPKPTISGDYQPKPEPAKRAGRCKRSSTARGARRIARTKTGVVYVKRGTTYACLYSRGRITRLWDAGSGFVNRTPKPQIKGRYVAYTTRGSAVGDEFDRVVVWDIRQARVLLSTNSTSVRDIALKSNGSVAWIAPSGVTTFGRPALWDVRQMSNATRQGDLLVNRASGIGPKSLALWRNGRTISWTEDGRRRTSTLP